jgi:RND family efflux transporter MFP subunit
VSAGVQPGKGRGAPLAWGALHHRLVRHRLLRHRLLRRRLPRHRLLRLTALWTSFGLVAACAGDGGADAAPAAVGPDTALFGAEAVAIAGFTTDTARLQPWRETTTAPARVIVDPARHQTLGSITEGRVTRVLVREGDAVRRGQLLVAIHSHEIMDARSALVRARSMVRTARAESEAAEVAVGRVERLLAAKAIGQAEVDRTRVMATAADARLAETEAELERAIGLLEHLLGDGPESPDADPHEVLIRAPIDGVVTARTVLPGTVVLPGDPLLTVADPRALQLELRLSDAQVRTVQPGSRLTFTLAGEGGADREPTRGTAVVTRVTPVVDGASRTTLVHAELRGVPPGLRAEQVATARLEGAEAGEALVVPSAAVQALEADTVVLLASTRGEGLFVEAVPVRLGRRTSELVEIVVGLEPGQVVLSRGAVIARAELLKRREGGGE